MKSIFIEIFFQDFFLPSSSQSSARKIDSILLLCILDRVCLLRLCIHNDIRLIPSWMSQSTYSDVISSGLDSNDISVSFQIGKHERSSCTSSRVRIDGVHPPK